MRIGLIDVDGHNGFPNLALMKLSAWHKAKGDHVEWYSPMFSGHMDRVYMSKVFTFTKDFQYCIDADEIVKGGTGYKNYGEVLDEEIEYTFPDYSIYPDCDYAIGFLTRGCVRKCPWCVVPKKEGHIRPNLTWQAIKRPDSNVIKFLDNNVLACEYGLHQIEELTHTHTHIDFNQGMDARLIDDPVARMLSGIHWHPYLRIACDTHEMIPVVEKAVHKLKANGVPGWKIFCYALIQDVEEAHERIMALDKMGIKVFAQPYINFEDGSADWLSKRLARWCNMKATFKTCKWEDYEG